MGAVAVSATGPRFRFRSVAADGSLVLDGLSEDVATCERMVEHQFKHFPTVDHCVIYQRDNNGFWQELTTAQREDR